MQQVFINIILSFVLYLLIAKSFSIVNGNTQFFHIAHAIPLTISGYFVYLFSIQLNLNVIISICLALLLATLIGMGFEYLFYRPFRKRNASSWIVMIASISLYTVLQNLISILWSDSTKSIRFWEISVGHSILGARITNLQILMVFICIFLYIVSMLYINGTRFGRKMRAVSSNSELCNIIGIHSDQITLIAFLIGSFLVSVAGILIAYDIDLRPTMGFNWLLYSVVAMIFGGSGNSWWLALSAFLLAALLHGATYFFGNQLTDTIVFGLLIIFFLAKPFGFSKQRFKKVEI